ncbi:MAG: histidine phosphatase family protein, partial [Dehalococcoidia bacterium]
MRLILVRHGESVGNAERRLQGQGDFPLTELGREQSRRLGRYLAREGVNAVYGSTIRRAWETAEAVGEALGLAPQPLPGVEEYDFG